MDKSLVTLDDALQRRFYFIPMTPSKEPVKGILEKWVTKHKPKLKKQIMKPLNEANKELVKIDSYLMIGPSYFMLDDLDEEMIALIWKYKIIPILEKYLKDWNSFCNKLKTLLPTLDIDN